SPNSRRSSPRPPPRLARRTATPASDLPALCYDRSMRWAVTFLALIAASDASRAADCTCRSQGRDYELGKSVCLQTPQGARIATCGMVLNNTSWQFSETPCVMSRAPDDDTPARHEHASGQARHGGEKRHTR